MKYQF